MRGCTIGIMDMFDNCGSTQECNQAHDAPADSILEKGRPISGEALGLKGGHSPGTFFTRITSIFSWRVLTWKQTPGSAVNKLIRHCSRDHRFMAWTEINQGALVHRLCIKWSRPFNIAWHVAKLVGIEFKTIAELFTNIGVLNLELQMF